MQIQATSIRAGSKLEFDDDIWVVLSFQHRTPGKGTACMQLKVRSLTSGSGKEVRFNSNERVELAQLEERKMTYSYHDGQDFVFMDTESYEQVSMSEEDLGDAARDPDVHHHILRHRPLSSVSVPIHLRCGH